MSMLGEKYRWIMEPWLYSHVIEPNNCEEKSTEQKKYTKLSYKSPRKKTLLLRAKHTSHTEIVSNITKKISNSIYDYVVKNGKTRY